MKMKDNILKRAPVLLQNIFVRVRSVVLPIINNNWVQWRHSTRVLITFNILIMTDWYLAQGIQYNNTRILTRAAAYINFREHNQGL